MSNVKKAIENLVMGFLLLLFVWFAASQIYLVFNCPWMTDSERLMATPQAMQFKEIKYSDWRER